VDNHGVYDHEIGGDAVGGDVIAYQSPSSMGANLLTSTNNLWIGRLYPAPSIFNISFTTVFQGNPVQRDTGLPPLGLTSSSLWKFETIFARAAR
jgi:hypothetical protein